MTNRQSSIVITGKAASIQARDWAEKRKEQLQHAKELRDDEEWDGEEEEEPIPEWLEKRQTKRIEYEKQ